MGVCIKKKSTVDICSGPIFRNIWKFVWPFMLTALLQRLYNAADVIVVGRYAGPRVLAGVGTTSPISNTILNLFLGLSVGVNVVLARSLGSEDGERTHRIVHTAISISLVVGVIISAVGIVFAVPLLQLIEVPEDVMPHAKIYMQIIFASKVPSMIYNFGSAILRSKGDTKRPLYIACISGIMNVAFNLFFVVGLGMGAAGVALGTVISVTFSASAIVVFLIREEGYLQLRFRQLRIYKKEMLEIMRVGLPSGIQSCMVSLSNMIVQSGINSFGAAAIAGSAAAVDIVAFYYIIKNAFVQVTVTFVSQNIGAKKYERLGRIMKVCLFNVIILGILEVFITLFAGEFLLNIYLPGDPEAVRMGMIRLAIVGCSYGLLGICEVMSSALRGMGYSFSVMIISLICTCGFRVVWLYTVFKAVNTLEGLYASFPVSWILASIINGLFFLYIWKKKKYIKEKK